MTRTILIALMSIGGAIAASAPAWAGLQLGQRSISRNEVVVTVKQQFAEMDINRDGAVSPAEFGRYREKQAAMPDQGRGLTHIGRTWFERCDVNGDGRVTLSEAQGRPMQLFDMADANRDGTVSVNEQSVAQLFMK